MQFAAWQVCSRCNGNEHSFNRLTLSFDSGMFLKMSLFEDFYRKERFIANRKTKKHNIRAYRLWRNRVLTFLEFCDSQHVFKINDISQRHYDSFIAHISKNKSPATVRDWKYALAYFVSRSHLDVKIQTSPRKQNSKRQTRAYHRLRAVFDLKTTRHILEILNGLL
jgi:hypothetical protein